MPEVGQWPGALFASYLDVLRELEAENYTMRIAAKRSRPLDGLEGSNPNFLMDYEGFGARSGEVD